MNINGSQITNIWKWIIVFGGKNKELKSRYLFWGKSFQHFLNSGTDNQTTSWTLEQIIYYLNISTLIIMFSIWEVILNVFRKKSILLEKSSKEHPAAWCWRPDEPSIPNEHSSSYITEAFLSLLFIPTTEGFIEGNLFFNCLIKTHIFSTSLKVTHSHI